MTTKSLITAAALLGFAAAHPAQAMTDDEADAAMAEFDSLLASIGSNAKRVDDESDALIKVAQADTGGGPRVQTLAPGGDADDAGDDAASAAGSAADGAADGASNAAGASTGDATQDAEPNNIFGEAQKAAHDGALTGTIQPKGDADWFEIEVDHQGELKFTATTAPATLDMSYRIWNADKYALSNWFTPLRVGGPADGFFDLPAPGRYVIEMRDGSNDAGSTEPYGFDLEFTPSADTGEPNDIFGKPTPIEFDAPFQSNILPKGDVDWYAVTVEDQGELTVNVTEVPENLDISFRIWNADKYALSSWFAPLAKGGPVEGVFDLPEPGTYVIEMRDGSNDERSAIPFTTQVSFIPSQDGFEPNDKFGDAKPLALDEEVKATILPKGDVDWYRIEAPSGGELQISVTGVAKDLDISYRVWNSDKYAKSNWFAPFRAGGDTEGTFGLDAPGTYYLEVRDGSNDNRSVEPYTLKVGIKSGG